MQVKYVQLEPAAFLSDAEWMQMSMAERGMYCTLIFLLYCNGGRLRVIPNEQDPTTPNKGAIRGLCGGLYNQEETDAICLDIILSKFDYIDDILTHKRVSEELAKSYNFVELGRKGAEKRWNRGLIGGQDRGLPKGANAKLSKVKLSKELETETNIIEKEINKEKDFSLKTFDSASTKTKEVFLLKISELFFIKPQSSNHAAFFNLAEKLNALKNQQPGIFDQVIQIAKDAIKSPAVKKPIAAFFAKTKELTK